MNILILTYNIHYFKCLILYFIIYIYILFLVKLIFIKKFLYELKVFLFKKDDFIIINITPDEIIKMIKEKILIK